MIRELLSRYKEKNSGLLPERILFIRDGMSESQLVELRNTEGVALREVLEETPSRRTPITLAVAIKRHHTRMFPTNPDDADRLGNCPAGTIIESGGRSGSGAHGFDFYLQAHAALIGTARPTYYKLILDENKLTVDEFQRLVAGNCSSYARSTSTVSVFTGVYYADQACARARLHLRPSTDGTHIVLPPVSPNLK
jgi:eukaryotic translation initiation factor 2C